MLRVLIIGPYPPPYGGWSRRIEWIKQALDFRGDQCAVLNTSSRRGEDETNGIISFRNRMDFLNKIRSYCRKGYAIQVHINGKSLHNYQLVWMCTIIAKFYRRKIIIVFHGGHDQIYINKTSQIHSIIAKATLFFSDLYICDSDIVKQHLISLGLDKNRIKAISPFTRQYLKQIDKVEGKLAEFVANHKPLIVVYSYLLEQIPSIETLSDIVANLPKNIPGVGIVLLGDREVEKKWLSLNLSQSWVFWQGNLPPAQFLGLLHEADVFVRHSPTDGVSSSILEAMALGVPVVASQIEGRPEGVFLYNLLDHTAMMKQMIKALQQERQQVHIGNVPETISDHIECLEMLF